MTFIRSIPILLLLAAQSSEPAFLGVGMDQATGPGVLVTRVIADSAAELAGLRVDDQILGIAGTATDSPADATEIIRAHAAGTSVQIVFRRGREMHVVDATLGIRPLNMVAPRSERVAKVVEVLNARPGHVIADIGFGSGWLSRGLAQVVGSEGLVIAVEIDGPKVEQLESEGIANIKAIHSKKDDVSIPPRSLDFAILHDVASHVDKESRPRFHASIARALKDDGRLVIFGPHGKAREMLDELAEYGFHAEDETQLDQLPPERLDERLAQGIRFTFREVDGQ